jgi:hypothetical protein
MGNAWGVAVEANSRPWNTRYPFDRPTDAVPY